MVSAGVVVLPHVRLHRVELVSILLHSAPVGPALINAGAALEVSVEHVNRVLSSNLTVTLKLMYGQKNASCLDGEAALADTLAKYYYDDVTPDSCVAIIGTGKKLTKLL